MDVSLDVSKIGSLLEDELCRRYDAQSRGSAGVPMQGLAKDMAKKTEADCECGKKDKGGRNFINTCSFTVSVILRVC